MSLTQSLSTALAGLSVTQSGLGVVSANVANAQTPGYVARTLEQMSTITGDAGVGVRVASINRQLNEAVQQQLRVETSGGAYADLRSDMLQQLQQIYGQPGSDTSFDALYNNFTSSVQALTTSPDSFSARTGVLNSAQALAGRLNSMSAGIQQMRTQAEQGIAGDVRLANQAILQIAQINQQLAPQVAIDSTVTQLEDQRDQAIDQLAKIMDIRVVKGDHDQVTVFTGSGFQLVGSSAAQLAFDARGTVTASQQWSPNPSQSSLGTINLVTPNGDTVDLVANGDIRSGELAAYLDLRDRTLMQAEGQIDELAAKMSKALSDQTTDGTAVTVAGQSGFNVGVGGVLPGDTVQLTYTDTTTNTQHKVVIVRVDDPAALPLSNSFTADPTDQVVGVNFTGGLASVVSQLNAALGPALQFNNAGPNTLQVLNGPATVTVDAASATTTATALASGSTSLPLFTDGNIAFSGVVTANGTQAVGYAGRIAVNQALLADPSKLVVFQTSPQTPAGDPTRPNFLSDQLSKTKFDFSPATGIGAINAPFNGTLSGFVGQIIGQQSAAASAADNLKQGQDLVVNALKQRFDDSSAVNVDTEMARLITLQNSYSANARVMTAVKQMLDTLLQM
jgi:flagellar hook-associated protein 1 FlgK